MFAHAFYRDMEKSFFRDIDHDDFIHFFMEMFFSTHSKNMKYGFTSKISHGDTSESSIRLKPSPGVIKRNGCDFCTALMHLYNKDYWLIKLWITMYVDSKESRTSKEIVRAFIINCINVTALELAKAGVKRVSIDTLNENYVSDKRSFYKKIFNGRSIWKKIRLKQRNIIKEKYNRKKSSTITAKIECLKSDVTKNILIELLEDNGMKEYIPLIEISSDSKSVQGITGPISYLIFLLDNSKGKKRIKKQISRLVSECRV